jgi:hypothetical protein
VTAISRLAADAALRERMGCAGRRVIQEHYSVVAGARHWLNVLHGLRTVSRRTA